MAWQVPQLLGGPVLHWELVRAARRPWMWGLRYVYVGWLLIQFNVVLPPYPAPRVPARTFWYHEELTQLEFFREEAFRRAAFAAGHVSLLLHQQLILLALITPAIAAGALGYEKERNTLIALFGTELTDRQIVTGKVLGRLGVLASTLLAGLPVLVLLAVIGDVSFGRLVLAHLQTAVLITAVAGAAMLSSVWTRRTADAILACYAGIIVAYLTFQGVLGGMSLPGWLDVLDILRRLMTPQAELGLVWLGRYLIHLLFWGGIGALCLVLAARSLRSACLNQMERRPARWLWAFRPAVWDAPVLWRERYVIGLAPLPWLRMIPGRMAIIGVLIFSACLAMTGLDHLSGRMLLSTLRSGDFALAYAKLGWTSDPDRVMIEISVMGVVLLLLATLVVGVRCTGSIREEKRRKTWDDLMLTPLSIEEIVTGKRSGVLRACIPHLVVYALPMLALSTMAGVLGVIVAVGWVAFVYVCITLAAYIGMAISAGGIMEEESPRRRAVSMSQPIPQFTLPNYPASRGRPG